MRDVTCEMLSSRGYPAVRAATQEEASVRLGEGGIDAIVLDCTRVGDADVRWLDTLARERPGLPILAMASCDGLTRERARAHGAHGLLRKPFSLDDLQEAVADLVAHLPVGGLVGVSQAIEDIRLLVGRVADSSATVLVTGESGVGKELVARSVHERSSRRAAPFVAVNCGAMNPNLLESELFGHVRGAFTDAVRDRPGCFERANGGTLFLDEISTLSLASQVRLLRVIQEREVVPVGDSVPRRVDVRIVTATNEPLAALVRAGSFREDLYYRLAVFPLDVPPLRRRREDLAPLIRHFLAELRGTVRAPSVSAAAMQALEQHGWPGNVRELRNVIERALVLASGRDEILVDDLRLPVADGASVDGPVMMLPDGGLSLPELIDRIERDLIRQSLSRSSGSRTQAARLLGLKRTTLVQKLKRDDRVACYGTA